jgi:hypothetical protein
MFTFFYGAAAPSWPGTSHCQGLMITLRHTTLGRTPLDKLTARRRDLYLTALITRKRQTSMLPAGFETAISASGGPQSRLRPRGHWDSRWFSANIILLNLIVNFRLQLPDKCGPAKNSRYSDLLPAGRSRDRTPVGGSRLSAPVQTGLGYNQPPIQWVPGLFPWGKAAGAWC